MEQVSACPIASNLFDDLTAEFTGAVATGVVKETLQLFIEQFSTGVLGEQLLGIERNTRDRLEAILLRGDSGERADSIIVVTIELAKELGAQQYASVAGFVADYVVPWLETIGRWLRAEFPASACIVSLDNCLASIP